MGRRRPTVTQQLAADDADRQRQARVAAAREAEWAEDTRGMPADCYSRHSLWFRESWRDEHGPSVSLGRVYQAFGALLKLAHQSAHVDDVVRAYLLSILADARRVYDRAQARANEYVRLENEVYRPEMKKHPPDVRAAWMRILDHVLAWDDVKLARYSAIEPELTQLIRVAKAVRVDTE